MNLIVAWATLSVVAAQDPGPAPPPPPSIDPPSSSAPAASLPASSAPDESAPASAPTTLPDLVVLPVKVRTGDPAAAEKARLLTTVLVGRLGEMGSWRVLSAHQVDAVLQVESVRMAAGCDDDECMAQVADALGANLVSTGEVVQLGRGLVWTQSVVDRRSSVVVARATRRGKNVEAFLAEAQEMARALAGLPPTTRDEAEVARDMGLVRPADARAFLGFHARHPELTASEALTAFILERNVESRALAAVEAALLVGAAAVLTTSFGLHMGAWSLGSGAGFEGALLLNGLALATLPVAVGLGTAGLGLAAWDAMDRGHVEVRRSGCCRQDSVLVREEGRDEVQRASALAVLLSGPAVAGAWLTSQGMFLAASGTGQAVLGLFPRLTTWRPMPMLTAPSSLVDEIDVEGAPAPATKGTGAARS